MPVLAQEGDVNEQGSCKEEGSEEYLWWPELKSDSATSSNLTLNNRKKKTQQLSGVLKL